MLVQPSPSLPTEEQKAAGTTCLSQALIRPLASVDEHTLPLVEIVRSTPARVRCMNARLRVPTTAGTTDTADQFQSAAGPVARNYCMALVTLALRGVDGVASKSVICC